MKDTLPAFVLVVIGLAAGLAPIPAFGDPPTVATGQNFASCN